MSGMVAPLMIGHISDITGINYMGMLSITPVLLIISGVVMRYIRNPRVGTQGAAA